MNIKKIISSVGIGAGAIILGLGIQYALAAGSTWSPAHQTPPSCDPALDSGCNPPINVGDSTQSKTGLLGLAKFLFNPTATPNITVGSVLTAMDTSGTVGWSSSGSGSGSIPSGAIMAFALSSCPTGWNPYTAAAGRTIIGTGLATASTTARSLGSTGGEETHKLTKDEMPAVSISFNLPIGGTSFQPNLASNNTGKGVSNAATKTYYSTLIGSGLAHSIMQPFIAELYCVKS